MADNDNSIAFKAAKDLVFDGVNQPSGYTEPILHRRRLEFKLQNNESNAISPNRKSEDYKDKFEQYKESPDLIRSIAADGCEKARKIAKDTMREVREEMGIDF